MHMNRYLIIKKVSYFFAITDCSTDPLTSLCKYVRRINRLFESFVITIINRHSNCSSTMKFPFFLIVSIIVGTTMAQDLTARDIQMAFDNDRVFKLYFGCLVGEITCTPKGQHLKGEFEIFRGEGSDLCNWLFSFNSILIQRPTG